jgi:hypothetical protein
MLSQLTGLGGELESASRIERKLRFRSMIKRINARAILVRKCDGFIGG